MARKSNTKSGGRKAVVPRGTASKGTTRDKLMQRLAADPMFEEATKSGQAYIIVGHKPPKA